jgi:hypothetical protein
LAVTETQGNSYDQSGTRKVIVAAGTSTTSNVYFDGGNTPTLNTSNGGDGTFSIPERVFNDGTTAYLVVRRTTTTGLAIISSTDGGATWSAITNIFSASITQADSNLSIDGNVFTRGSSVVIPYVVNDGGTLKYNEYLIRSLASPSGWNDQWPRALPIVARNRQRASAFLRGDDGIYNVMAPPPAAPPFGYDPPPVHHRKPYNRAAAGMRGSDGTDAPKINFFDHGFPVQPPQPPRRPPTRSAAAIMPSVNVDAVFQSWRNAGWEVQAPQPPHRRPERGAAILEGDDGTEAPFVPPFSPPPPLDMPTQLRARPIRLVDKAQQDPQAAFQNFVGFGFEVAPPVAKGKRTVTVDDASLDPQNAFQFFRDAGFVATFPQPPHPRPERFGAIARGSDGTEGRFQFWINDGWEIAPHQPGHPRRERAGAILEGDDGNEGVFAQFVPLGWPVQDPQPRHPRPERAAAAMTGDDGIQATFTLTAAQPVLFEPTLPTVKARPRITADDASLDPQQPYAAFFPLGFQVQDWQPPHPRPERAAATLEGDDGIEGTFVLTAAQPTLFEPALPTLRARPRITVDDASVDPQQPFAQFFAMGFEPTQSQPLHPRREKAGAAMRGDDGSAGVYQFWRNSGWEVQPPQPPHPRPERSGALARGEDGTEGVQINFVAHGWPTQHVQPPHPRPERAAAVMLGDDGDQAVYQPTFTPAWWEVQTPMLRRRPPLTVDDASLDPLNAFQAFAAMGFEPALPLVRVRRRVLSDRWTYDPLQPFARFFDAGFSPTYPQPPHPRPERGAAILEGDDGSEGTFTAWRNAGWEVQPPQPPHPRRERAGSIARGLDGTDSPFAQFVNHGWPIQPPQPPHPRPERAGALFGGDPGNEAAFAQFFAHGFPVQPVQPPHPRPERGGAIMRGDDGTQAIFQFIVTPISVFETTPPLLPRPTGWRAAALMRGDDGTQATFARFFDHGWAVQHPQPPHPRRERWAGLIQGDVEPHFRWLPWPYLGFEPTPPLAAFRRHPGGAIAQGSFVEAVLVQAAVAFGWQMVDAQLRRPPTRRGAALRIDDVISRLLATPTHGWPVQPWQPPRPRWWRAGSTAAGDQGTQRPFALWRNDGWEVAPPMLRRPPRRERFAVPDVFSPAVAPPAFTWQGEMPFQPPHPRRALDDRSWAWQGWLIRRRAHVAKCLAFDEAVWESEPTSVSVAKCFASDAAAWQSEPAAARGFESICIDSAVWSCQASDSGPEPDDA